MLTALVLSAMLGQTAVATPPSSQEMEAHNVLAPITVVPVRSLRKNIISASIGWNDLGGEGLQYTRNLSPYFALDGGLGLSFRGAEVGVRGRWNMLNRNVTPFIGLGVGYGTGTPFDFEMKNEAKSANYTVKADRSPLAQGTVGVSWQNRQGLSLMGMVGYTQLLRSSNVLVTSGIANDKDRDWLKRILSSGPAVAVNIGYAF